MHPHDWSVKCGFGWQRKESLYLWNSKRLHATALRGENAKLACHSLVQMSFPYVWKTGSIFSYKKNLLAISLAPAKLFFQQHISAVEFPLIFLGWGSLRVVGGLFLFPESTRHQSRAAYLISREENPSPQLLLIRVKWSRPTNSYRTPKKLSLSFPLFLSVPSSLSVCAKFRRQGKLGRGCVAWGLQGSGCSGPPCTWSPFNLSRWKCVV